MSFKERTRERENVHRVHSNNLRTLRGATIVVINSDSSNSPLYVENTLILKILIIFYCSLTELQLQNNLIPKKIR